MMAKNPRKDRKPSVEPIWEPVYDVEHLASATECTGMVPAAIPDEETAETYAFLYAIHTPKANEPGKVKE